MIENENTMRGRNHKQFSATRTSTEIAMKYINSKKLKLRSNFISEKQENISVNLQRPPPFFGVIFLSLHCSSQSQQTPNNKKSTQLSSLQYKIYFFQNVARFLLDEVGCGWAEFRQVLWAGFVGLDFMKECFVAPVGIRSLDKESSS